MYYLILLLYKPLIILFIVNINKYILLSRCYNKNQYINSNNSNSNNINYNNKKEIGQLLKPWHCPRRNTSYQPVALGIMTKQIYKVVPNNAIFDGYPYLFQNNRTGIFL